MMFWHRSVSLHLAVCDISKPVWCLSFYVYTTSSCRATVPIWLWVQSKSGPSTWKHQANRCHRVHGICYPSASRASATRPPIAVGRTTCTHDTFFLSFFDRRDHGYPIAIRSSNGRVRNLQELRPDKTRYCSSNLGLSRYIRREPRLLLQREIRFRSVSSS